MKTIEVYVEDDLKELAFEFLEKRRNEIGSLFQSLEAHDFPAIAQLGHKIKGVAGGLNFNELGEIGARLETAAKAKDAPQCRKVIESLRSHLEQIEIKEF